ncbi:hypothetical protein N9U91_06135 [Pelagibacteraceae bacterium]|nr:hypothetical protein [Pelagibacteraceae bacterium]
MTIKSITVYCSSSDKLSNKYYQDAEEISKLISSFKINIVYGGRKDLAQGGGSDVSKINESIKYVEDKLNSIS